MLARGYLKSQGEKPKLLAKREFMFFLEPYITFLFGTEGQTLSKTSETGKGLRLKSPQKG